MRKPSRRAFPSASIVRSTGRVLALALLGGAIAASSAAASAFPGTNGRIAFAQETGTGQTSSIMTANPNGSGVTPLTSGQIDNYPRYSADGNWVVFERFGFPSTSPRGAASHVMIIRTDGTGLRDLSGTALQSTPDSDSRPSFSPDGTEVVFSRTDQSADKGIGLFEVSVSSGNVTQLTTADDSDPSFSPDGTKIAFSHIPSTNQSIQAIYTMPAVPLAGATQVTHPTGYDSSPDWSPNGQQIVFDRDSHITVQNSDGSGTATTLTSPSGIIYDRSPAFSPDGTKIIFARTTGQVGPGGSEAVGLYTMNTNGSGVTGVPGLGGTNSASNYSPDWGVAVSSPQPPPSSGCGSSSSKEPDANGDKHSNCHTGSKGRGAGGNDKPGR